MCLISCAVYALFFNTCTLLIKHSKNLHMHTGHLSCWYLMSPRTGKTIPMCPCRENNGSSVLWNLVLRGSDSFCKNVFNLARGSSLCLWRSARTAQWIFMSKLFFFTSRPFQNWMRMRLTKFNAFVLENVALMSSPPQEN